MIGMQEMLLQEADGKILLFPAWPKDWNVDVYKRQMRGYAYDSFNKDALLRLAKAEKGRINKVSLPFTIYFFTVIQILTRYLPHMPVSYTHLLPSPLHTYAREIQHKAGEFLYCSPVPKAWARSFRLISTRIWRMIQ